MATPTTEQIQAWLDDARAKYHLLITGTQTVSIRFGERLVTYTAAKPELLLDYIKYLESLLAGVTPSGGRFFTATQRRTGY
jgi:gpW protein